VRKTSGFGGGEFPKTLRKVCTCQKLKFAFLLLEYCKSRECYAVANAFTEVFLTNFFAEPTVLRVLITSRDKMTKRRRTDNAMVKRRRTDNTMIKKKKDRQDNGQKKKNIKHA
jgi:ribosomal protein S18